MEWPCWWSGNTAIFLGGEGGGTEARSFPGSASTPSAADAALPSRWRCDCVASLSVSLRAARLVCCGVGAKAHLRTMTHPAAVTAALQALWRHQAGCWGAGARVWWRSTRLPARCTEGVCQSPGVFVCRTHSGSVAEGAWGAAGSGCSLRDNQMHRFAIHSQLWREQHKGGTRELLRLLASSSSLQPRRTGLTCCARSCRCLNATQPSTRSWRAAV